MRYYARLDSIDRQVYISLDDNNGQVIQTDIATYYSYYKLLGWKLLGRASQLPGISKGPKPLNIQGELGGLI